ncbi:MAG: PA2778 family cysteine peptidase [Bdellovibrionota bacterium]
MIVLRFAFVASLAIAGLSGCATTAPQSTELLRAPGNVERSASVAGVPFIEQKAGHCGPATLTMAMRWAGHDVAVDEIAPRVMTSAKAGSLQEDMIGATRREGLMAIRLEGLRALLSELSAGHPVIVFENLGLSWAPQWHYAIVTGYDLDRRELVMHSGPEADERVDMKVFERSWKHSNYWALVVLPVGAVANSAGELENMRAAAGLELASRPELAEVAYRAILAKWPDSLSARIGIANVAYAKKDFRRAVSLLEEASRLHPSSEAVRHNLAVARRALDQVH